MDFEWSPKVMALQEQLNAFMERVIYPNESVYEEQLARAGRWTIPPVMEEMKRAARAEGLWNLFLPDAEWGAGLTNLEYAPLCEIMGHSLMGPEVFNCNAPDTGNMEVLAQYGSEGQKSRWLEPLLQGEIRSCFAMTEPAVASSDATNIATRIDRDGDDYIVNGRKWWSSGAADPRCRVAIVMGRSDAEAARHEQQSMILVPLDTPGVKVVRSLPVFGYDDAPHGHAEILLEQVRVPADHMIWAEGKGFAIAQGRLGPGRIHHCMRLIGMAERALSLLCERVGERRAFGRLLSEQGIVMQWIADSRMAIDQARLLTLTAAWKMDQVGNKAARKEIAMIKVVAPHMALQVIDRAIQAFGGMGVSDDVCLARFYASARTLRLADGPDEVHTEAIAKLELKAQAVRKKVGGQGDLR